VGEKAPSIDNIDKDTAVEDGQSQIEIEPRSKGVIEMEALRERINVKYLCLLYGTFALLAYVLSLSKPHTCPTVEGRKLKAVRPVHF
jgi:hypothetical protein